MNAALLNPAGGVEASLHQTVSIEICDRRWRYIYQVTLKVSPSCKTAPKVGKVMGGVQTTSGAAKAAAAKEATTAKNFIISSIKS